MDVWNVQYMDEPQIIIFIKNARNMLCDSSHLISGMELKNYSVNNNNVRYVLCDFIHMTFRNRIENNYMDIKLS